MATIMTSDFGGSAPENFHISYSNDGNDSSLGAGGMRCPLCYYPRRHFHCKGCIRNGDFHHSAHHLPERFAEKQQRLRNIKSAHATLESKCVRMLAKRRLACQLRADIKKSSEGANLVRNLLEQKQTEVERLRAAERKLKDSNRVLRMKLPRCDDKVKVLSEFVLTKLEQSDRRRRELTDLQDQLCRMRRESIEKLIRYIFPISQIISSSRSTGDSSSDGDSRNTINEISEATRTAYVRGRWVLQDSFGEVQHVIVAPALPGTGNYSAYNDWANVNTASESVPGSGEDSQRVSGGRNPAHTIAAALTYTMQLVQIIAFYLDTRLPYKVAYSDFCTGALSEPQFTKKVARLNANVLSVCYSQGCRLNDLHPTHTLENVLHLLRAELGRGGPTDRTNCLSESDDYILAHQLGMDEDSDAEETTITQEWEAVPSNLPPPGEVYQPIVHHFHHHQLHHHPAHHQPTTASLVTSAVASMTSFWKGWTGK